MMKISKNPAKVQSTVKKASQPNKVTVGKGQVKSRIPLRTNLNATRNKNSNNGASVNGKGAIKVGAMAARAKTIVRQKSKIAGKAPVQRGNSKSLALGKLGSK